MDSIGFHSCWIVAMHAIAAGCPAHCTYFNCKSATSFYVLAAIAVRVPSRFLDLSCQLNCGISLRVGLSRSKEGFVQS
jgi:hypothetical protein